MKAQHAMHIPRISYFSPVFYEGILRAEPTSTLSSTPGLQMTPCCSGHPCQPRVRPLSTSSVERPDWSGSRWSQMA